MRNQEYSPRRYPKKRQGYKTTQKRRDFLKVLAIGGTALAGTGGYFVYRRLFSQPADHQEFELGSQFPEIMKYYPEVARLPVLDQGEFETSLARVKWLNLTASQFRTNEAIGMYTFLESLPGAVPLNLRYRYADREVTITWKPRERIQSVLLLTPLASENPRWVTEVGGDSGVVGATMLRYEASPVTYIKVPELQHDGNDANNTTVANTIFVAEACNSSISVTSLYADGSHGDIGQEMICNSLAQVYKHKLVGSTYAQYLSDSQQVSLTVPDIGGEHPIVLLDEQLYNIFPASIVIELR